MKKWPNWTKLLLGLCVLAMVLAIPATRMVLLLILPLGSGIDDLLFFVVIAAIGAVLLMKVLPIPDKAKKFAKWFYK